MLMRCRTETQWLCSMCCRIATRSSCWRPLRRGIGWRPPASTPLGRACCALPLRCSHQHSQMRLPLESQTQLAHEARCDATTARSFGPFDAKRPDHDKSVAALGGADHGASPVSAVAAVTVIAAMRTIASMNTHSSQPSSGASHFGASAATSCTRAMMHALVIARRVFEVGMHATRPTTTFRHNTIDASPAKTSRYQLPCHCVFRGAKNSTSPESSTTTAMPHGAHRLKPHTPPRDSVCALRPPG